MTFYKPYLISILSLFLISCSTESNEIILEELEDEIVEATENETIVLELDSIYNKYEVEGSFILVDLENDQKSVYNDPDIYVERTPASTFKICNSIIGLETGVITDENFIIEWDGVERRIPSWNQDTDLGMALQNSTVWYYQEVARRIDTVQMQFWLHKLDYGNKNMGDEVDQFWLNGDISISPMQQAGFLESIINRTLEVSDRTIDILEDIMTYDSTDNYIIRAKTGWGFVENEDIGWFIGWIEKDEKEYVFVNCIQTATLNDQFGKARIDIVYEVLRQEGLIEN
jgi:beta-lactamase class D